MELVVLGRQRVFRLLTKWDLSRRHPPGQHHAAAGSSWTNADFGTPFRVALPLFPGSNRLVRHPGSHARS